MGVTGEAPVPPAPSSPPAHPSTDASASTGTASPPAPPAYTPNYVFLAAVSVVSLGLDLGSKAWAKARLDAPTAFVARRIEVWKDHLAFSFARNRGGAWGLLQDEPE